MFRLLSNRVQTSINSVHPTKRLHRYSPHLQQTRKNLSPVYRNKNHHLIRNLLTFHKIYTTPSHQLYYNLPYSDIYEHELTETGCATNLDTVAIYTGEFTGRSPNDKYFVKNKDSDSNQNLWWGPVNKDMEDSLFTKLFHKIKYHYEHNAKQLYICDAFAGSNKKTAKSIRFITEYAWQHHFVKNMFIRPTKYELSNFTPDFTIMNACNITHSDWNQDSMNSQNFVTFDVDKQLCLIGGTHYGGEMKKGVFSMMNYWLPLQNILSMHCSANVGKDEDTALFFGLSGTGKTTLSTTESRELIGDDQHGWDNDGIFNFEGGCYAKTNGLEKEKEPLIYDAIRRDALLENVYVDSEKQVDFHNSDLTENGRVSYPIEHISNHKKNLQGDHPNNIFFLTCDAFGVLPPISKLSHEQALYYFLSGYTAKIAGTERGVTEPKATFSACFGEAFLTLHPTVYANLLQKKLTAHQTNVYLVNTGWSGGSYGIGERMSIETTQACIDSVFSGDIDKAEMHKDPFFKFNVPTQLPNVLSTICQPRKSWKNQYLYEETVYKLIPMFQQNYKRFQDPQYPDYSQYGPQIL